MVEVADDLHIASIYNEPLDQPLKALLISDWKRVREEFNPEKIHEKFPHPELQKPNVPEQAEKDEKDEKEPSKKLAKTKTKDGLASIKREKSKSRIGAGLTPSQLGLKLKRKKSKEPICNEHEASGTNPNEVPVENPVLLGNIQGRKDLSADRIMSYDKVLQDDRVHNVSGITGQKSMEGVEGSNPLMKPGTKPKSKEDTWTERHESLGENSKSVENLDLQEDAIMAFDQVLRDRPVHEDAEDSFTNIVYANRVEHDDGDAENQSIDHESTLVITRVQVIREQDEHEEVACQLTENNP